MTARLHVLLGAGGVGKTTLAAAYALALARAPGPKRRVGLLGIDPAQRLQTALGVVLGDCEAPVASTPNLLAATLVPHETLNRWVTEAMDPVDEARLTSNPFFVALADRLATANDLLASVRVAEWLNRDPSLTDLVVDTAPGLGAIEFLRRPKRIAAFLEGRLVVWLRAIARAERLGGASSVLRRGARRLIGGMGRIAGPQPLLALAEFLLVIQKPLERMIDRIEGSQRWLHDRTTEIVLVTAVRDDAVAVARQLAVALQEVGLAPRAVVVNRTVPDALVTELNDLDETSLEPEAAAVVRYARAYASMQQRVVDAVVPLARVCVTLPNILGLDAPQRIDVLAGLGEHLRTALGSVHRLPSPDDR